MPESGRGRLVRGRGSVRVFGAGRARAFRAGRARAFRAGRARVFRAGRILAAVLLLSTMLSGCFAEPSPLATVKNFLLNWQEQNYSKAAGYTDGDRQAVAAQLGAVRSQLEANSMSMQLGAIHKHGSTAMADFTVLVELGDSGNPWNYGSRMRVRRVGDNWKVVWSPSVINPYLRNGQRLAIVTQSWPRQPIQDSQGRSLLRLTKAEVFGVVPGSLPKPDQTLGALARITSLDKDRLVGRVLSAPPQTFLPLVTIQLPDATGVAARLSGVDGLQARNVMAPLAPVLAPDFVGQLAPATAVRLQQVGAPYQPGDTIGATGLQALFQRRLAGIPVVEVVSQDLSGANTTTIHTWNGYSSAPVKTTLLRSLQAAAERALKNLHMPASLVAVDGPTGEVTAVANHQTGGHNLALEGRYPPGMTFSIVSSQVLLQAGQKPTAPLPCPATQAVGDQVFRTDSSGGKTLQSNFAKGCSTAFVSLVSTLTDKDLRDSAARFGIGADWGLPVPAFSGSVPTPVTETDRAADMIGQGNVQVSPLAMALAAATVDTGTWRPPQLLNEPYTSGTLQPQYLDRNSVQGLKSLMQAAVTKGGAHAADLAGTQINGGVAATVDMSSSSGKTVSWFVGYKGDMGFALAVEGKVNAAKIAAIFLKG